MTEEHVDQRAAGHEDAPVVAYTFTLGEFSGEIAYVMLRMAPERARILLRDLEHLLAEQPDTEVIIDCLGALCKETPGG